ncbi:MAG: helix-turn-helix domain-containing protein [Bacteroidales bacterium]|nr:helix-turn-helix domain-containing protein [Bacteroidales bacterium]
MVLIEIGKKIRERRNTLRITQSHLAEMAGVSESTLHKIETGKANPTITVLNQIAEILGLEIKLDVKK